MNQLLTGGRPVLALAKDCCYRDISSLVEDLQQLQQQKSECEANYAQAIKSESHAHEEIARLKEEHNKLSAEMSDIKEVALSVESEANQTLESLHNRNTELKQKLNESRKRIQELEARTSTGGAKDLKLQIQFLQDQLKSSSDKGKAHNKLYSNERLDLLTYKIS